MHNKLPEYFKRICLLVILLCVFLLFFHPIETSDVWWHLATGQWIAEHGQVPDHDIFSPLEVATEGMSPQWLGSLLYYGIYQYFGSLTALQIFRASIFVVIILLAVVFFYRRTPFWILILGSFFLVMGMLTRFDLRPYIFNFLFIQSLLQACLLFDEYRDWRYLIPIPFIGILWFNIHLGSLIYGLPILSAFSVGKLIQCASLKYGDVKRRESFPQAFKDFKIIVLVTVCYVASFLLNPYGINGTIYPFRVFLDPSFISFYQLGAVIVELQPPKFILTMSGWWVHLLFLGSLLALVFDKKRKMALLLLFIFSTFFYLRYARTGPFFVLVSTYTIFDSSSRIFKEVKISAVIRMLVCLVTVLGLGYKTAAWVTQKSVIDQRESSYFTQALEENNPQAAINFMKEKRLTGLIFNSSSYGGYLLWAAYPAIKPFADNRQYDFEIYGNYLTILKDPTRYWPAAQKDLNFQISLLDVNHGASRPLIAYLLSHPDWVLVFFQDASAIFVRRDHLLFRQGLISSIEPSFKAVSLSQNDYAKLQAVADGTKRLRRGDFPHYQYVQDFQEGMVLLTDFGHHGAGVKKLLRALPYLSPSYAQHVARAVLDFLKK